MSFVFYPNHERRCPDLMHCPRIGGAALGYVVSLANENDERRDWLFRQLDATREESAAKSRRIAELEERVKQLEAELKAERQKQFKAAKPEEEQASAVVPGENQAKSAAPPSVTRDGFVRRRPRSIARLRCPRRQLVRIVAPPFWRCRVFRPTNTSKRIWSMGSRRSPAFATRRRVARTRSAADGHASPAKARS